MKKITVLSLLWLCTSCSVFKPNIESAKAEPPPKVDPYRGPLKKVLVLKFFNFSAYGGDELADKAYADARNAVLSVEGCTVLKEEDVPEKDTLYTEDRGVDRLQAMKWARSHGVAAIVYGAIDDVQMKESGEEEGLFRSRKYQVVATVRMSLLDTATDREMLGQPVTEEATEEVTEFLGDRSPQSFDTQRSQGAVRRAMDRIFASLPKEMKKIAWSGHIARVDLHRYYINAGIQTGLSAGQLLKVYGEGLEIKDPASGTSIGIAPGRFKGILKVVDNFGDNGAVAVVHSGAGFREKDRVEVYAPPQK